MKDGPRPRQASASKMEELELEVRNALKLSPAQAKIYSKLIQRVPSIPKSDPRFTLVIAFTWWLIHRRRRLEQQRIRRKQFYRRWRRILLLHRHFKRNAAESQSESEDMTVNEQPFHRPAERQRQRFSFNKEVTPFWLEIVNNEMNDEVFQQYFHMTKATFDFLYQELREHLSKSNTSMREALPGKKRLAVTLFRIANNAEYLKVSNLFSIGKSTTTSLVRDVCEVIVAQLKHKYLTWFMDVNSADAKAKAFDKDTKKEAESIFRIPNCYGVLGSIDVFTVGSSWNYADLNPCKSLFYNGQHALAFQTVVSYKGLFGHMSVPPQPSGLSNVEIYNNSFLEKELIEIEQNTEEDGIEIGDVQLSKMILISDPSYPLSSHIMTPFIDSSNNPETDVLRENFNSKLSEASALFDEAIFKLKRRWKIFHGKNGKINFNTDTFENIALTCCILHNICEMRGDTTWTGSDDPACKATDELLKDELFRRTYLDLDGISPELYNDEAQHEEGKVVRDALSSYIVSK